jgi:hypothetical protein
VVAAGTSRRRNIGTNTGAITAHLADALPMNRSVVAENTTNATSMGVVPTPVAFSASAPSTAVTSPRFDHWNHATNCAMANASTM